VRVQRLCVATRSALAVPFAGVPHRVRKSGLTPMGTLGVVGIGITAVFAALLWGLLASANRRREIPMERWCLAALHATLVGSAVAAGIGGWLVAANDS
jgi:hypothetical protein